MSKVTDGDAFLGRCADTLLKAETEGVEMVGRHLFENSDSPLPTHLLDVLDGWLAKHHGIRLPHKKRGVRTSASRHKIDHLVDSGTPINEAVRTVHDAPAAKKTVIADELRCYRRHNAARTSPVAAAASALIDGDLDTFGKKYGEAAAATQSEQKGPRTRR